MEFTSFAVTKVPLALATLFVCVSHTGRSVAMDCSLWPIHGVLQARILEWVAIASSGDLPESGIEPASSALQADSLPSEPPGKPRFLAKCFFFF